MGDIECVMDHEFVDLQHNFVSPRKPTWHQMALAVHCISHLVFVLKGPYVIETRGGEERRGVAEQLTAGAYRKKHLQYKSRGREEE